MKKTWLMMGLMLLSFLLSGCGPAEEKAPAAARPLSELAADIAPEAAAWTRLPQEDLADVLGILPGDYTEYIYWQESGMTGRELLALRAKDQAAAERIRAKAESYLERRRKEARDYLPSAYQLLAAAKVEIKNSTVALIVGEQAADQTNRLLAGE